jgi:hypothetical protein
MRFVRFRQLFGALCVLWGLSGCSAPMKPIAQQEDFNSTEKFSRMFDASPAQTCEAARRALLSQGYVISSAGKDLVQGQKSFQPENETHVQVDIRVVCVPDSRDGKLSLGFVTALQDRYALKKSNSSASLGVGVLGSLSVPVSSSNDAMVKVGSETVASDKFYDRFFTLVQHYLVQDLDEPDSDVPGAVKPVKP